MLKIVIRRIRPEKEARLRAWLTELNARRDEVRATFRDETVRAEKAYIIPGADGPLLVYAMEAEDFATGAKAYSESPHAIDREHAEVMRECLGDFLGIAPLYDVSLRS